MIFERLVKAKASPVEIAKQKDQLLAVGGILVNTPQWLEILGSR